MWAIIGVRRCTICVPDGEIWHDEGMSNEKKGYVDPGWPEVTPGEHAVTEIVAHVAGGLSPYGDVEFPVEPSTLSYVHPYTVVNK